MRRRLPLNAVRAFEAAARHKSLARAADELCVTPTAISHQIRLLEDFVQVKLFTRRNGRLELTPAARDCVGQLSTALDHIDAALSDMVQPERSERVVVGASPSVTSLWLLPRLQRFTDARPGTDIVLNIINEAAPPDSARIDIWIASSNTTLDMRVEPLMGEEILPVCAPKLLAGCRSGAEALRELPLIHDEKRDNRSNGPFPTWERYFTEFGIRRLDMRKGLRFGQSSLAVDAAVEGHGMLLGRSQLIRQALAEEKLVQLARPYPIRFQYFMVSPWQSSSPAAGLFRNWLLDEASAPLPV
jgi:LysR family glycine cleavage system transcriptional activator